MRVARKRTTHVGFALRYRGRPAIVVLSFDNTGYDDPQAFLDYVAGIALRRAEDKAASAAARQGPRSVVTQIRRAGVSQPGQAPAAPEERQPSPETAVRAATDAAAPPASVPTAPVNAPQPPSADSPEADPERATALPRRSVSPGEQMPATELIERQAGAIRALAQLLDHGDLAAALHALANGIAQQFSCQRVSIGLVCGRAVRIAAMSGVADIQPRSALAVDICQAMQETCSAGCVVRHPCEAATAVPAQAHVTLASQLKNPALMSVPLLENQGVTGAVLLERDYAFGDAEAERLEQLSLLVAPVIALRQRDELTGFSLIWRIAQQPIQSVIGPTRLGPKLFGVAALLAAIASMLFSATFRVGADAIIEANVQRAVVANVDSFLTTVERRAGDVVYTGDVLARLDTEELQLERIRWEGERDKLAREYRATLAQRDRSNVRVLEARRDQAQAQIDLIDSQLARSVLRAPIDGVVIAGDLSQMLGSPVERGQMLFEIAALDGYRLVLMVDETDVGWIEVGRTGNLRLRSLPEEVFPFAVTSVTPVSEPGEGANRFRVEADPVGLPDSLRPGMQGAAKIDIDERPVGWIWTRSLFNWLRLQLWQRGL